MPFVSGVDELAKAIECDWSLDNPGLPRRVVLRKQAASILE